MLRYRRPSGRMVMEVGDSWWSGGETLCRVVCNDEPSLSQPSYAKDVVRIPFSILIAAWDRLDWISSDEIEDLVGIYMDLSDELSRLLVAKDPGLRIARTSMASEAFKVGIVVGSPGRSVAEVEGPML